VRTHSFYDTVEVRICDMPTSIDHTVAIVALVQALMVKLYLMYKRNTGWRSYARSLIEENKWRALRYGTDAKLIDFGLSAERPLVDLMEEMVDFVDEATTLLGTKDQMNVLRRIVREGTSAHRQLEVYNRTKDLKAVVDWLIEETMPYSLRAGCPRAHRAHGG
jgi:carboxylate-amine ligase